jgi:hypothetical protein
MAERLAFKKEAPGNKDRRNFTLGFEAVATLIKEFSYVGKDRRLIPLNPFSFPTR